MKMEPYASQDRRKEISSEQDDLFEVLADIICNQVIGHAHPPKAKSADRSERA